MSKAVHYFRILRHFIVIGWKFQTKCFVITGKFLSQCFVINRQFQTQCSVNKGEFLMKCFVIKGELLMQCHIMWCSRFSSNETDCSCEGQLLSHSYKLLMH